MKKRMIIIFLLATLIILAIFTNFSLANIEEHPKTSIIKEDQFTIQKPSNLTNQPVETRSPTELRILKELEVYEHQQSNDSIQGGTSIETITIPEGHITIETEIHN